MKNFYEIETTKYSSKEIIIFENIMNANQNLVFTMLFQVTLLIDTIGMHVEEDEIKQ